MKNSGLRSYETSHRNIEQEKVGKGFYKHMASECTLFFFTVNNGHPSSVGVHVLADMECLKSPVSCAFVIRVGGKIAVSVLLIR